MALGKVKTRIGQAVVITPLAPKEGDIDVHAQVSDFQRIPILGEYLEFSPVDEAGVHRAKDICLLKPGMGPRVGRGRPRR